MTEAFLVDKVEEDVNKLLSSGQAYEKSLLNLERTLYAATVEFRNKVREQSQLNEEEKKLMAGENKHDDLRSNASKRSKSSSVYSSASAMAAKQYKKERVVYHEDPQAKLIPTED